MALEVTVWRVVRHGILAVVCRGVSCLCSNQLLPGRRALVQCCDRVVALAAACLQVVRVGAYTHVLWRAVAGVLIAATGMVEL